MADTTKTQFYIDNTALEILNRRAPERKRGEFISKAIYEIDQRLTIEENEQECGTLEQIASQLRRIESRLIALDLKLGL